MNKQDFIFTLFDNGDGLTFDQIEHIENCLIEEIPEGMIEDIAKDFDEADDPDIIESAMYLCRDNFMNNIHDCGDMLELRSFLSERYNLSLEDMQVYRLWYVIGTD